MICGLESVNRNKGGVKSIKLIDSAKFISCEFCSDNLSISSYELEEGTEFCNISYYEDSAYFNQTFSLDRGFTKVKHELSFYVCDADESTNDFLQLMMFAKIKSLVALVTCNNSDTYLVGFSKEFLAERPLKFSSLETDTAYSPSSRPMTKVCLLSEDTRGALKLI
ncbi:MAG: hypothetical protein R3Y38_05840 [Rikenellaceae bacterium]